MALTGGFEEISFEDLLQLHAISRQTVAVRVHLGPLDAPPDGVFYFDGGDLIGATMRGAEGREAIRQVLRLREGRFVVDPGVRAPNPGSKDQLRLLVMEEITSLDEERALERSQARSLPTAPLRAPVDAFAEVTATAVLPLMPVAAPETPPSKALFWLLPLLGVALVSVLAWAVARTPAARPEVVAPVPPLPPPPTVRGVKGDEVLLGMVASLTGSNKEGGRAMKAGWELALTAANDAGGINGRKLRLLTLDDGYDPSRTAQAMKELVDAQQVFAVVGNVGTANAAVAAPICIAQKVVFFAPMSGADLLRKSPPERYVFNYRASLAEEASAAVRYLVDAKHIKAARIAVLVQNDTFGDSGWRGATEELEARGVAPSSVPRLEYVRNTADIRQALEQLRSTPSVQAVVLVATYKPAATFIRKAKDTRPELLFVAVSPDSNSLAQELVESGPQTTENVVVTQVVPLPNSKTDATTRYRQALERFAPTEPMGSTTLEAWISAQLFLEGVKRAGPELDTEKLVAALEGLDPVDLGTGVPLSFGPQKHQASQKVWGWALKPDGTYAQVDLE